MQLRSKKSHIRNLPEGSPPRKITPILFKYFYFLVLLAIIGLICYFVALKYLFFTGVGMVRIDKTVLSSQHGGTLVSLTKKPGESFGAGEVLAVIDRGNDCPDIEPDTRLTRLTYDIRALQAEYEVYTERQRELEGEEKLAILPRALEIGDAVSRQRLERLQRDREETARQTALLRAEIAVKKKELAALEKKLDIAPNPACTMETITAPMAGEVYHTSRKADEYIEKGEALLAFLPGNGDVFIEVYFDDEVLSYLFKGENLSVTFADGRSSQGTVAAIASDAANAARPIRTQYRPAETRLIRVDLVPVPGEEALWKNYDRMAVTVEGKRR